MRQRNAMAALMAAACLVLAGCGAGDEAPVRAEGPSPAPTAEPSSPATAAPPRPSEPPADPPSSPPAETPTAGPEETAPGGYAEPPYRRPLPRPSESAPTTPGPSAPPTRPSEPSTPPKPPPPPQEVGGPSGTVAFGQTYEWDNGLQITAGRPAEVATEEGGSGADQEPPSTTGPSAGALEPSAGAPEAQASIRPASTDPAPEEPPGGDDRAAATAPPAAEVLAVDFTVVNGTDKPVNTSFYVAMTSGGADAPAVHDPGAGLGGPPGTMLQPGKTVRFTMGFEARDPADLTLEVRPAYHYVSAVFARPTGAQG